ncbi:MAG: rod shape-determining protein MreD, partial [Angustibacter sp.]
MTRARVYLVIVLVLCAQLVDSVGLSRWSGPAPDITLLVVISMAVLRGPRVGLTVGLAAGVLADLVPPSAGLLGWTALAYGAAGALAGRWYRPL